DFQDGDGAGRTQDVVAHGVLRHDQGALTLDLVFHFGSQVEQLHSRDGLFGHHQTNHLREVATVGTGTNSRLRVTSQCGGLVGGRQMVAHVDLHASNQRNGCSGDAAYAADVL